MIQLLTQQKNSIFSRNKKRNRKMNFDLEADLWAQAEFTKRQAELPATLLERKMHAKPKPSIYDVDPDEQALCQADARTTVDGYNIVTVRGRPIKVKHEERPGNIEFHRKTQSIIREVCGVGHSNEASESYIKLLQRQSRNSTSPKEKRKVASSEDLYSDVPFDETNVILKDNVKYSVLK